MEKREEILLKHIKIMGDETGEMTIPRFDEWKEYAFAKTVFNAMEEYGQYVAKDAVLLGRMYLSENQKLHEKLNSHTETIELLKALLVEIKQTPPDYWCGGEEEKKKIIEQYNNAISLISNIT
jgi:hypothetical protein